MNEYVINNRKMISKTIVSILYLIFILPFLLSFIFLFIYLDTLSSKLAIFIPLLICVLLISMLIRYIVLINSPRTIVIRKNEILFNNTKFRWNNIKRIKVVRSWALPYSSLHIIINGQKFNTINIEIIELLTLIKLLSNNSDVYHYSFDNQTTFKPKLRKMYDEIDISIL